MHPNLSLRRSLALGLLALGASGVAATDACAQLLAGQQTGSDQGTFGWRIANAGDVDGDGIDDVLVAEPNYVGRTGTQQGRVCVYSGATFALIRTHIGGQSYASFGATIAGVGDLNSDHYDDYAVVAPDHDSNSLTGNGEVTVYSGKDGSVLWTLDGTKQSERFGSSIARIDDANSHGQSDVLIGDETQSLASVYDGTGALLYTLNGGSGQYFGASVAACGDLDGDGVRDFVVGEPKYYDPAKPDCGAVHVYSAKTGTELYSFLGTNATDGLGITVSSLGDVDGDAIPDLLAGSPAGSNANLWCGVVRVVSGKDGATIRETYGDAAFDLLGTSLVGMGDMDHDGVDDYAAGAPDGGATQLGYVRVFSGSTGAVIYEWQGSHATFTSNGDLGGALAAGDFNGDGIGDLVIGDRSYATYDPILATWSEVGGAFMDLGCPSWWENYGAGWPGKKGVPAITSLAKPVPGNDVYVQVDNSLGVATTGLLFIGFADASFTTGKGGTILVDPSLTTVFSVGSIATILSGNVPDDPQLYFLDLYLQALEVDPFASKGLSFTAGLKLHFGFDLP